MRQQVGSSLGQPSSFSLTATTRPTLESQTSAEGSVLNLTVEAGTSDVEQAYRNGLDIMNSLTSYRPSFVILYGPMASGKSTLTVQSLRDFGIDKSHVFQLTMEMLVHQLQSYRNESSAIYRREADLNRDELARELEGAFDRAKPQAYELRNKLLRDALSRRLDVTWEATGNNMNQLFGILDEVRSHGYQILLTFPLAHLSTLLTRMEARHVARKQHARSRNVVQRVLEASHENMIQLEPYLTGMALYDYDTLDPTQAPQMVFSFFRQDYCGPRNHMKNFSTRHIMNLAVQPAMTQNSNDQPFPVTSSIVEIVCGPCMATQHAFASMHGSLREWFAQFCGDVVNSTVRCELPPNTP